MSDDEGAGTISGRYASKAHALVNPICDPNCMRRLPMAQC